MSNLPKKILMSIVISKKKKYIILLLCMLILAGVTAGIYLLFNPKTNGSTSYTVDKYSDVTSWCDTSTKDNQLNIDCKALLLDIHNTEEGNSCFDVQVITKDEELKDFSVCEKGDTLSYTNEVLGYKVLMPIDIVFTYTKEGVLGDYSFNNVSFAEVDNTYIQGIVNEDIADLVTIDPSTTTIQNSVDFCPRPETLPSYVTENNKTAYTEYFNRNIMTEPEYKQGFLYTGDDTVIRILFACDSAQNLGYKEICHMQNITGANLLPAEINKINVNIITGEKLKDEEIAILKDLSLVYDHLFINQTRNNLSTLASLNRLIDETNKIQNVNEEVLCSMYKIYQNVPALKADMEQLQLKLTSVADKSYSSICSDIGTEAELNQAGVYIKKSIYNMDIYERCINLTNYIE